MPGHVGRGARWGEGRKGGRCRWGCVDGVPSAGSHQGAAAEAGSWSAGVQGGLDGGSTQSQQGGLWSWQLREEGGPAGGGHRSQGTMRTEVEVGGRGAPGSQAGGRAREHLALGSGEN